MSRPANEVNPGEQLIPVYVLKSDKARIRKHKKKHNYQSDSKVINEALNSLDNAESIEDAHDIKEASKVLRRIKSGKEKVVELPIGASYK